MARPPCPDTKKLQDLLAERLDANTLSELSAHIESCPTCQKTLENLAPMSRSWTDVLAAVSCDEPLPEPGLERVLKNAGASVGGETQAEPSAGTHDESLAFLAPSTKQGHLGRLGHYEILEIVGKGGFGTVLKAFDEKLHRMVAIKVLAPELAASGTACKRFIREAQAAAAVKNEHVVGIYNVEDEHRPPYLVMELIDGISLEDRLKSEGPLELKEILRIGMQMAEGLAAAHKQGLIHRDIKPGNILLENGVQRVKITDFGLARAADDASVTQSGVIAGTPMFMAPEQAAGDKLDHRADLFSLGSVLYVMCTGRPPFRASTTMAVLKRVCDETPTPIREINPDMPDWLCAIVAKLQAKKADDRFGSAKEIAELLGKHLADVQTQGAGRADGRKAPVEAPAAESINQPQTRHGSPKRALFAAASVGVLTLVAILAFIYWPRDLDVPNPPDKQPPVVPVGDKDGWVQLFNGKDLTGWKTHPIGPGEWKVEDGVLSSTGPRGYLFTDQGNYSNFHLRAEARVNSGGDGGIVFRTRFNVAKDAKTPAYADGYQVVIDANRFETATTGTLLTKYPDRIKANQPPPPPDTWFLLEVIARGDLVQVLINGKIVVDYRDPAKMYTKGHIALHHFDEKSRIDFRKIEIKELPPEEPGWVQLFNGQDLTGWVATDPRNCQVEDETIILKSPCYVGPDRRHQDFHLRLEAKVNANGTVGVDFRHRVTHVASVTLSTNSKYGRTGTLTFQGPGGYQAIAGPGKELVPADTWCVLEIIARGKQVLVKVNGVTTAEATLDEMASTGRIVLCARNHTPTVAHFRKIEIKELPPTPPAKGPFVILAKEGRPEEGHATLKDAVAKAQSGDTIEIRGDGPFEIDPIFIGKNKPLTIRAGDPFRPVLRDKAEAGSTNKYFLMSESPLVVEGLCLEIDGSPKWQFPVLQTDDYLLLAHCRLIHKGRGHGCNARGNLKVSGCEIFCAGGACLSLRAPTRSIWLEDNVFVSQAPLLIGNLGKDELPHGELILRRNTVLSNWLTTIEARFEAPLDAWIAKSKSTTPRGLRVTAEHNVFHVISSLASRRLFTFSYHNKLEPAPDATMALLPHMFAWQGKGNAYGSFNEFLGFIDIVTNKAVPAPRPMKNVAEWGTSWGGTEKDSLQGAIGFTGPMLVQRLEYGKMQLDEITPADFRLTPGSPGKGAGPGGKDLGADVDLVGPGAAYEKWKKTPTYQEWRKQTDALMASAAGPFVILARDKRGETRHGTLADAVKAAQSGDTIEIRGDGPFVTEPIVIGRDKLLTVRAEAGSRPVLQRKVADDKAKWFAWISTSSPLVLEGLTLELEIDRALIGKAFHVICNTDRPLRIAHCRLTIKGWGHCINSYSQTVDVHQSELIAEAGAAITINPVAARSIKVKNSVLAGEVALMLTNMGNGSLPRGTIELQGSTLIAHGVGSMIEGRVTAPWTDWQEQAKTAEKWGLHFNAENNLFAILGLNPHKRSLLLFRSDNEKVILDEKQTVPLIPRMVPWKGRSNLFGNYGGLLGIIEKEKRHHVATNLETWQRFWGDNEKSSTQGEIRFADVRLENWLERANLQMDQLRATNFRLAKGSPGQGVLPGGKDLGADVDLVGPGAAYEKWQKTKEYEEWRKQTDALMANAARPFVILARDKRAEMRHATLADAVKAAQSGDTIEIRGDRGAGDMSRSPIANRRKNARAP